MRAGAEVAQAYAALPAGLGEPPGRRTEPGEGRAAAGPGAARRRHDCGETLRDLGRGRARVAVECGSYRLSVAASSRDPNALSQPVSFNGARL
ncbi:beta-glucosidase [Burkholderia mallei]|nr:beta-glucosidase [Burkholderia mallei]